MTATDPISDNGVRIRVRPWRGGNHTAECVTTPPGALVSPWLVTRAMDRAREEGYQVAVTQAIPPYEWRAYLDAGFEIRERLHLLGHDLLELPETTGPRLRRAGWREISDVLEIDQAAFVGFWQMDRDALREALRATPSSRLRVTDAHTGYALTGRAGDRGYIQRLAVRPEFQGEGLGTHLVADGLRWLRRWRVREALVNTQESNTRAVDLYHRLGFRTRPGGLAVLEVDLTGLS